MFRKMCIVAPTPVCRFRGPLTPLGPFAMFPRLFDAPRMYQREPISVTEEADKVLFELELPRFRPEDVKFTVDKERGVVGVRGQRKDANGEVQAQFERSFSVSPRWLDLAGCETKVEHGVATLTIPKKRAGEKKESEAAIKPQESKSTEQATATESNKAASTAVTEPSVPRSETQVKPASEDSATTVGADSYKAVRSMSWPPRFETEDSEREIVYTCDLPSAVQPDNVDVSLERGYLSVGIRSTLDSVQKDSKGNVVFQNTRSVHYSTALGVPRGTGEDDVAVQLKEGKLRIAVKKHDESSEKRSSSIKVSSE